MSAEPDSREIVVPTEPAWWWGPGQLHPPRRYLSELIRSGFIGAEAAELLWAAVERGRSVTIAAGPAGAGKSTLLASLLPAIPANRARHFVRGNYESVDFRRHSTPANTALLVNEISPHLPVYCWGSVLCQVLGAGAQGCQVLSTIHGTSVEGVVRSLAPGPMSIPLRLIVELGILVFLDFADDGPVTSHKVNRIFELKCEASCRSIQSVPLIVDGITVGGDASGSDR